MRILYVRHGKSLANANSTIALPDTPLAEEGLEQARATGQDLKSQNVIKVVCSPFIRAQQTAEIIAAELGIPTQDIVTIDELHERRMGELEGKPKNQESAFYYENDADFGLESRQAVIDRTFTGIEKLRQVKTVVNGSVVVVGHSVAGFYFLQVAKGKTKFEDFDPVNQIATAEFMEIELI